MKHHSPNLADFRILLLEGKLGRALTSLLRFDQEQLSIRFDWGFELQHRHIDIENARLPGSIRQRHFDIDV